MFSLDHNTGLPNGVDVYIQRDSNRLGGYGADDRMTIINDCTQVDRGVYAFG